MIGYHIFFTYFDLFIFVHLLKVETPTYVDRPRPDDDPAI